MECLDNVLLTLPIFNFTHIYLVIEIDNRIGDILTCSCTSVGNVGSQPQSGMVNHGGNGSHTGGHSGQQHGRGAGGGGGGHYNAGMSLAASQRPNAPGFVPMGQVRPDKGSNSSRYNPIGMGGGYNVYNWN